MPFPDEASRSAAATGTEQDNLFTRQARALGGRGQEEGEAAVSRLAQAAQGDGLHCSRSG